MRSLSPSLIFTCTRTLSPGFTAGMSLRCSLAASFSMMGCCDMTLFPFQFKDVPTSEDFKFKISNLKFSISCLCSQPVEQLPVFLAQRLPLQQVRAIMQSLF